MLHRAVLAVLLAATVVGSPAMADDAASNPPPAGTPPTTPAEPAAAPATDSKPKVDGTAESAEQGEAELPIRWIPDEPECVAILAP